LVLSIWHALALENGLSLHLAADAYDARIVEVLARLLADVRDVARDFLRAELGIPGHALELLDVHRREVVFAHDALRDQDGILEVVTAPRHEGDEDVAPERELAHLGRR